MNGFKRARLQSGLTQKELSDLTGIHPVRIVAIEGDRDTPKCTETYLKWSKATNVPIDDLLKTFPDDKDLHTFSALKGSDENLVYLYAKERRLTCRELGMRMGKSHERARQLCHKNPAKHHVEALAAYENMSVEEFWAKFGQQV